MKTTTKDNNSGGAHKPKSSFVTIGSIDFSGKMIIKVRSRVLDKQLIKDIEFNLDELDKINERVKDEAQKAHKMNGRRGCTTDELYNVIRTYINEMLQTLLTKIRLADIDMASKAFKEDKNHETWGATSRKKIVSGVKSQILGYVKDIGDRANVEIDRNLKEFGFNSEHVRIAKDFVKTKGFPSNTIN